MFIYKNYVVLMGELVLSVVYKNLLQKIRLLFWIVTS